MAHGRYVWMKWIPCALETVMKDCLEDLTELGNQNKVIIALVPGHERYKSDEKAKELALKGSNKAVRGPSLEF